MNPYSVIMLDMDGTLSDSGGQISPNTKKLLVRLEKRGIPVVLCSSGSPGGVDRTARLCGLNDPAVCYGGSLILDENRNILEDSGIENAIAIQFRQYAAAEFPDVAVTNYLYDIWLVDSRQDPNVRKAIEQHGYEAVEGELENAVQPNGHIHKIMCLGSAMQLKRLQTKAASLFPSLNTAVSGTACLEVTAADVSRYTAMQKIRRYYHLMPNQIVAVGNCFADIDMLKYAGLGIAMGNAPEAVRQAAARVTASSDEEGVYIALKNLKFRPPCQNYHA